MDLIGALLVILLFAFLLHLVRLVSKTKKVLSIGQQAIATLRNNALSDDEKERKMQQDSLRLLRLLFVLTSRGLVAILLPLVLIWLFSLVGLFSFEGVLSMFMRWDFILGSTALGIATYVGSVKWLNRNS